MQHLFNKTLIAITCGAVITGTALADNIPAGTQLADKQQLIWNIASDPATFDPQKAEGSPEGHVARQLFETLVISDKDGHIIPGAASSWEHSPDYKTWTFHIRPNAKWSNGDPLTAQDFVYGWQRLADPKTASPYSSYLDYLKLANADAVISGKKPVTDLGVEATDPHTLVLHLSESVPYLYKLTEHYVLAPANKKVIEKYGDKWTEPGNLVGNGAFKLKSTTLNEKTILEKNPYYWDKNNVHLTSVILLPIASPTASYARYRAGDEDIGDFPLEAIDQIRKDYKDQLYTAPSLCTYVYEINNKKAPFTDPKVRRALSLALDRNIIVEKITRLGQVPAYRWSPIGISGSEEMKAPEWSTWTQAQRNAEAIKLLNEAGFNKQHPLKFSLLYNTSENHKKIAIAAASMWKKAFKGAADVKMENQEWKTYLDTRHQGNFDVVRAGWCADYNEATTFLTYFLSNSSNNTAQYQSKAYDDILSQAYKEKTDEERAKDYAKAEALLDKDAVFVPVYHYTQSWLIKPYVKGFGWESPAQNYYLKNVYIIKH